MPNRGQVQNAIHQLKQIAEDLRTHNRAAYWDEVEPFIEARRRHPELDTIVHTGLTLFPGEFRLPGAAVDEVLGHTVVDEVQR